MLVLSLLFLTVILLLVFSFTKDTGINTIHARRQGKPFVTQLQREPEVRSPVAATKVAKVS